MSNNIGIAIPNNYSRAPMRRMPVPTSSRVSSLPHMGNYTLSSNQRFQNNYNTPSNLNNHTQNTSSNYQTSDQLKETTELRDQIETLTRNLSEMQTRLQNQNQNQNQNSQSRSQQYQNNVQDELAKEEGEDYPNNSLLTSEPQIEDSYNHLSQQQQQSVENTSNNKTTSIETLTKRVDKLEMFYSKEIDDLTRTVSILKTQFTHLEKGYRNISSALTNIVEELEQSPDEDVILTRVDETLDIKDVDNQSDTIDNSEQK